MTVREAAEQVLGDQTWDSAIPQSWVDWVCQRTGRRAVDVSGAMFVWAYDDPKELMGRPCALTMRGNVILAELNAHHGMNWPLTAHPVDENVLTKEQAMTSYEFHRNGCECVVGPRGGKTIRQERWRRNGKTQTWKTRPDEFRVPVKYGLKTCGALTQSDALSFHAAENCPLNREGETE